VEHGVFGYGAEQPEFHQVMHERFLKRYGWNVEPEAMVLMPGVTPGNNTACRAFARPGDGVLMQLPVYPPILRLPDNVGMSRDVASLTRGLTAATPSTSTPSSAPSRHAPACSSCATHTIRRPRVHSGRAATDRGDLPPSQSHHLRR